MSGTVDISYGDLDGYYQVGHVGPPTTVRIVVENRGRPLTSDELVRIEDLAKAANAYLERRPTPTTGDDQ